ncbi:hypothetical protein [Nocardioides caricicola]|uniref:Uncharacterized protein n=1 Tax=Nocardioides caricicola TaxID=634770 RepID=A0ABW0N196_9ACTN
MNHPYLLRNVAVTLVAGGMVATSWTIAASHESSSDAPTVVDPWSLLAVEGVESERYASLDSMVDSGNVSILGTVRSVSAGRAYSDSEDGETQTLQLVDVEVAVDDVLAGSPTGTLVTVEFGPYPLEDLDTSIAGLQALLGEQSVYVLRRKGSGAPTEGVAPDRAEYARGVYRTVSSQGLLDDQDGTTTAPLADIHLQENAFLSDLVDRPFDEAVAAVDHAG